MKFGMNLLLWTDQLHDGIMPVLRQLKDIGYDGVEVPMFSYDETLYRTWGQRLDGLGLERTVVTIRTEGDNPISPDPRVRAAGVDATRRALDCCKVLGAKSLCGPFHSALGLFSGKGPTEYEWKWGVESMRAVAEHAATVGVTLAVEYLNRFETYFLTCAADTVRFISAVNHPNCRMMYDTFHANIEEKNVRDAILTAAPHTAHVHISENDRSTPGRGGVRWQETFDAFRETGYNGWMVVEAFGLALPAIAAATKIWRRMYENEEQLARDALAFMKGRTAQ
ncbi:MAG TPA: sugar phosphate isomerase/epimerase [Lacipirellulaceae bacterium]|jgi:D-psicose/D-tagatose/L-ribulose 3-epimerase|nr:sugar phosphate isomerase/epimerase [Lacipirellulaceae bacterium]